MDGLVNCWIAGSFSYAYIYIYVSPCMWIVRRRLQRCRCAYICKWVVP